MKNFVINYPMFGIKTRFVFEDEDFFYLAYQTFINDSKTIDQLFYSFIKHFNDELIADILDFHIFRISRDSSLFVLQAGDGYTLKIADKFVIDKLQELFNTIQPYDLPKYFQSLPNVEI